MHTTAVLLLKDGSHRHAMWDDGERPEQVAQFFRESLKMGRDIVCAAVCYGTRATQYTANEVREITNVRI